MPPPKDPQKCQEWKDKLSRIAKEREFGKWNKGKKRKSFSEETKRKMSLAAKARGLGYWNKGKHFSSETRLKMSRIAKAKGFGRRKGHIHSAETKLKISQSHKARYEGIERVADLHPSRGASYEYGEWRTAVFERDDYTCRDCGQHGGELNAHHMFQWSTHELFRYLLWNGITLCKKCHKKIKVQHKKKV